MANYKAKIKEGKVILYRKVPITVLDADDNEIKAFQSQEMGEITAEVLDMELSNVQLELDAIRARKQDLLDQKDAIAKVIV
jgi:hypothetical protein